MESAAEYHLEEIMYLRQQIEDHKAEQKLIRRAFILIPGAIYGVAFFRAQVDPWVTVLVGLIPIYFHIILLGLSESHWHTIKRMADYIKKIENEYIEEKSLTWERYLSSVRGSDDHRKFQKSLLIPWRIMLVGMIFVQLIITYIAVTG